MKEKKVIVFLLAIVMCLALLAGCGHEHVWTEADCVSPKTCSDCGETEGEALGHKWTDASCTAAKTCSDCGMTEGEALAHQFSEATCTEAAACSACGMMEGEALGHQLSEANYQSGPVCYVCGETVGEALVPDFVKYGISADMQMGQSYVYNTVTPGGEGVKGETIIKSYDIIASDDIRVEREGYQWHIITFESIFSDPVALQKGFNADFTVSNYYDIAGFRDGADHSDPSFSVYTVNFNGEDVPVYLGQQASFEQNADGNVCFTFTVSVQVPAGYDGVVVGLNSAAVDGRIENYLYDVYNAEDFILFRVMG